MVDCQKAGRPRLRILPNSSSTQASATQTEASPAMRKLRSRRWRRRRVLAMRAWTISRALSPVGCVELVILLPVFAYHIKGDHVKHQSNDKQGQTQGKGYQR